MGLENLVKLVCRMETANRLHALGIKQDSIFHWGENEDAVRGIYFEPGIYYNPAGLLSAWTANELAALIGPSQHPAPVPVAYYAASLLLGEKPKEDAKKMAVDPEPFWCYFTLSSMKRAKNMAEGYAMHLEALINSGKLTVDKANENIALFNKNK